MLEGGPLGDGEGLAAPPRIDAGPPESRREPLRVGDPRGAGRVREGLAALREPGLHELPEAGRVTHLLRRRAEQRAQHRALHLRRGQERAGAHDPLDRDVRLTLKQDGEDSPLVRPGRGREALRHLALHEEHGARDARGLVEEREEDGRGEVVREVADHGQLVAMSRARARARARSCAAGRGRGPSTPRRRFRVGATLRVDGRGVGRHRGRGRGRVLCEDPPVIEPRRVRLEERDPFPELTSQHRRHVSVALDRDDPRAAGGEPRREVSEPGAELDDELAGAWRGEPRDLGQDRLVAEEVLAPALLRAEPVLLEQRPRARVAGLRRRRGHSRHPGSALRSRPARSPRRSAWVPATAIIAALSVQSWTAGTNTCIPSYSPARAATAARSRLFAATPPESTMRSNWSRRAARNAFSTSARTIASW